MIFIGVTVKPLLYKGNERVYRVGTIMTFCGVAFPQKGCRMENLLDLLENLLDLFGNLLGVF